VESCDSMDPLRVTVAQPNCLPEFAKQIKPEITIAFLTQILGQGQLSNCPVLAARNGLKEVAILSEPHWIWMPSLNRMVTTCWRLSTKPCRSFRPSMRPPVNSSSSATSPDCPFTMPARFSTFRRAPPIGFGPTQRHGCCGRFSSSLHLSTTSPNLLRFLA